MDDFTTQHGVPLKFCPKCEKLKPATSEYFWRRQCEPDGLHPKCKTCSYSYAKRKTLAEKFWERVAKGANDQCWEWVGVRNRGGYGVLSNYPNGNKMAHRYSYELHVGSIPADMVICHRCDNPSCVNPAHLFLGTQQDNVRDKVKKNRQPRGKTNGQAKLTPQQVREIRRLYENGLSLPEITERFPVCKTSIFYIVKRVNWSHLR